MTMLTLEQGAARVAAKVANEVSWFACGRSASIPSWATSIAVEYRDTFILDRKKFNLRQRLADAFILWHLTNGHCELTSS
jgi:hypothetical protein